MLMHFNALCILVDCISRIRRSTLFLHGVCMLCECIYGECANEQHVKRTLTLTLTLAHTITAYSVSGNVVRVRILICATRQTPCRKRIYRIRMGVFDLTFDL